MSILSKYWDKSIVINLDRRPDRMKETKEEFDKWGLDDVYRFPGVDGKTLDISSLGFSPRRKPAEIGLILTHMQIFTMAKQEGLKSILMMEDDVVFEPEFANLEEYMKNVPEDWDMFYIGANHTYGKPPQHVAGNVYKLNFSVACQAFAVRDTMYDKILDKMNERQVENDVSLAQLHKDHNVYGFIPNLAKQRHGFSDIQHKFVNYDRFF